MRERVKPGRRYRYVGPAELTHRPRPASCRLIRSSADVVEWLEAFAPTPAQRLSARTTFVIDPDEQLWVADRRSEHVACAVGGEVLAAGEIGFRRVGDCVEVNEVTNQSTGYCPEPECWQIVRQVLDRLGIPRPAELTSAFVFRRCEACRATNIVKDAEFDCAICNAPLNSSWNFT